MKNILIPLPCLLRGGTEKQTLNLVMALFSAGYSVTTLCYFEYDLKVVLEFEQTGSSVKLMNLNRSIQPWKLVWSLRKIFMVLKPDLVHVQYLAPGTLPIIAARMAGVKIVLASVHQPWTTSHRKLAKILLNFSAFLCTYFISVSQNAEKSWFGTGQLFDENIPLSQNPHHFTIYNAVDLDKIKEIQRITDNKKEKENLKIPQKQVVIGNVSRLRHEKGIDILIRAFAQVLSHYPEVHLMIVGTGSDEKELKRLALVLMIEKKITFIGKADWENAMKYMAFMDIVVVPSRFEGFGLTAAEAMAMGKPVIASNVFGLCEVVENNFTGLLFPSENIEELVTCITKLYNDVMLREMYGEKGLDRVKNNFMLNQFDKKIVSLYNQIFTL